MRIFVTGGSGFIGTSCVERFRRLGWDVLNYDVKRPNLPAHVGVWMQGDVRDRELVSKTILEFEPDYVLHLAAATGVEDPKLTAQDFDTNTAGVQSVIAATENSPSVKRAVFVSSLLVCRNGYVPKNDLDYCPPNPYGESKMLGEQIVRSWTPSACDWVIVRPTSVWGPWFQHSYKKFFQMISRGLYVQIGGMADLVKPITFVGNTAYMLERLLIAPREAVSGKTFYLADYPQVSVSQWAAVIRTGLNAPPIRTVPYGVLRAAARVGDVLKKMGWTDIPLSTFRLENMMTGGLYAVDRTARVVGELPYSLAEGVRETVDWMRGQRLIK